MSGLVEGSHSLLVARCSLLNDRCDMSGPLEGYRVIELAEGVAGPYCTMELGDAGADVIKIEPAGGDRTRGWGPPQIGDTGAVFVSLNRNKRSIVLDLTNPSGIALARQLMAGADVVVVDRNRLPSEELAYESVGALNSDLVYCAISGFGDQGPWKDRPGADLPVQLAAEATASLGRIGEPPVRVGTDIAGMYAAINSVQAICAALLARERVGGQRIEVSLFGSVLALRSTLWVALSNPDEWWGFHLDSYVKPPDHGYQCRDRPIYFSLARMDRTRLDALLRELGMEWVKDDPLFHLFQNDSAGGGGRYSHVVKHLWERGFARFTAEQVIAIGLRHGALVYPMNDFERLVNNEQVQHLGMVQTMEQPGAGTIRNLAPPWHFSETPASVRLPAPRLGEHGPAILAELGIAPDAISSLMSSEIVRTPAHVTA